MALSLGKLSILVGAGILGSVLAKEGRIPSVSDVLSGALKIALKPIKQNDSASIASKPRNDSLIAQVNSLRQELQLLASNRPVTIMTSSSTGGRRYGVIIVVVVIGYGYVWCKGWKLPDLMFATKRSLADACNSVAKQLEQVYGSISAVKRDLSSKVNEINRKCDDNAACTAATKDEVTDVRGEVSKFTAEIDSVSRKIQSLSTRFNSIHEKQDETTEGVARLMLCTLDMEDRFTQRIQDFPASSSRPALEHSQITASSRTGSLPTLSLELPSPSVSNGSNDAKQPLSDALSATGLKEGQGISGVVDSTPSPRLSNSNHVSPRVSNGKHALETPTSQFPPRQFNIRSTGVLSRTISATQYFKF